jgi:hypothetical protein
MEILEQHIKIENDNLAEANYLIFNLKNNLPRNNYGIILTKIKLNNNKVYSIVIESNSRDNIDTIKSQIHSDENMDKDLLEEYFINGMDKYLTFNSEAYFRTINENDLAETKYVFSNYYDALGYLKSIDKL